MNKLSSLSVFFPCYNEDQNIPFLVERSLAILPKIATKFEIIIIDDGSSDRSLAVARKFAKTDKRVKVVSHKVNQGYGMALRSGFRAASFEWVFFTDGDLQFNLEQLAKFVPFTKKNDVVIGYRNKRADGQMRALNARLFKLYIDILFRLHVRDIDCAFKLFRTSVIQGLELESTGAFISAEFLYKLKKKNVRFVQLPVEHLPRLYGNPTGNNPKVVIRAGLEALKLYLHIKVQQMKTLFKI